MALSTLEQLPAEVAAEPAPERPRGSRLDPWVIALLTAAISCAGSGRPSLWFDEAATISASASRTVPELWRTVDRIDAVHGLYYFLMHGWFSIVSPTEFWARFPSCVAVGVAAAGVVVFTRQFAAERTTALCAGTVFAILPRTTLDGMEARPYALVVAVGVWMTILFVVIVRRSRPRLWFLYVPALALSILLNLHLIFLAPVHATMLPMLAPKNSRRSHAVRLVLGSAVAIGAMIPYILFAHRQVRQVDWIYPISWHYAFDIAQRQYFDHSTAFAIVSGTLIVAAILARSLGRPGPAGEIRAMLTMCVAWIAIPTTALVAYSAAVEPIYYPRYLIFTTPAMAIILATCVVTLAGKPWPIAGAVLLFAGAAVPGYLFTQRWPYSKEGWDYSQVADVVSAHAAPGDCLLMDNSVPWIPGPIRALLAARPAAYRTLVDVGRGAYGPKVGALWDGHVAVWLVTEKINKCKTLWTVTDHDTSLPDHQTGQAGQTLPPGSAFGRAPAYRFPSYLGFHIVERWQFHYAQVVKSTR